jgi:DNA-binding beta-propeller fold protein YncE
MKNVKFFLAAVMVALVAGSASRGEVLKSLDYHGRWPDASQRAAAVDPDRGLLFHADGNVLSVLTTADLSLVSKLDFSLSTGIQAVVANAFGTYVYAACGKDGLWIVDVADAVNPVVTAVFSEAAVDDSIFASGIACLGSRVYIADVYFGLRVINVSDPVNPFLELA